MRELHAFSAMQSSASTYALMDLVQNPPRDVRVADLPFQFPYQRDRAIPANRWDMYTTSVDRCAVSSLFV